MAEIRVPTLGESVTEATIGKWFKKPGEAVAVDEPLVELETDKVTIEVPAPAAGVLSDIAAKDGETVAVGAVLGQIKEGAGAPGKPQPAKPQPPAAPPQPRRQAAPPKPQPPPPDMPVGAVGAQAFRRNPACLLQASPAPERTAGSPRATCSLLSSGRRRSLPRLRNPPPRFRSVGRRRPTTQPARSG